MEDLVFPRWLDRNDDMVLYFRLHQIYSIFGGRQHWMAMCGTVCIFVVSICFKFTEYFVYGNGSRFPLGIMPSLLRHNTVAPRFQVGLLSGVMFVTVMMIPTIITDVNNQWCWGISSIGRARALQARGTEIETRILHNWNMSSVCKLLFLPVVE